MTTNSAATAESGSHEAISYYRHADLVLPASDGYISRFYGLGAMVTLSKHLQGCRGRCGALLDTLPDDVPQDS